MAGRLSLDISMRSDGFDKLESTYRDEGLSVGADHMRLYGEDVHLEVSFNDLIMGKTIGHGACSSVNIAKNKRSNDKYAIKLFNIYDRAQASQLYNEILLLTSFSCDALISLKGAFHDQGSIGVILEYMDRGSLEFLLQPNISLPEDIMASIAFQVLWGCGYLHHEKQIHRDIKPGNALMNSQGQVKLSDFGISKALDHTTAMSNSAVGSYMYMSPERLLGDKYDASADVWSVGVSVIQIYTKKYPFHKVAQTPVHLSGELETFDIYNFTRNNALCSNMSSGMKEFIIGSMQREAPHRKSCMELVFDGSWFTGHQLQTLEQCHEKLARWLRMLDRQQQSNSLNSSNSQSQNSRYHAPSQQQRQKAAAIVRDVMEQSMDMSQSFRIPAVNNNNNSYNNFDNMEMSMDASFNAKRVPNPFMSSGSLTSSQVINMTHALNSYNNTLGSSYNSNSINSQASNASNRNINSNLHYDHKMSSMQEDEVYDDDFEADDNNMMTDAATMNNTRYNSHLNRGGGGNADYKPSNTPPPATNNASKPTGRASDRWRNSSTGSGTTGGRAESKSDGRPASGRRY